MMLFAPFLLIYLLVCMAFLAGLFLLIQIEVIRVAFMVLGLSPRAAVLALLVSLMGSYMNIPLYTVESGPAPAVATASNFGVTYSVPSQYGSPGTTTVALNVGGALIPVLIAAFALLRTPVAILPSILGTAIVALVTHRFAHLMPGVGIVLPLFVPPIAAAIVAIFLARTMRIPRGTHVIAYVSGVVGTLIGADLTNLHGIANLGAPVASIGGMGTFDGVFLSGIAAVLLAGF
jgi:uncharacterized membrane protein